MSRAKDTQNSRDLLTELRELVAIENLTAFNKDELAEKNVQIVIPTNIDGFKGFLSQNHEQIFRGYIGLPKSNERLLYVATLKACGYLYAMSIPTGNMGLVNEILDFAPKHPDEFNNIVAYSKVVTDVSQNMMRQKTLFQKLDKTKSYDVNTLSQIIKEARFVLQNTPELFHSHTIYQQAKKIDELAQRSQNPSVVAAYEAVTSEEELAAAYKGAQKENAKFDQLDKALSSRFITQEEDPALIRELEQLVASQKRVKDPPGSGQGPPVESQQRKEQQTLTKQ